MTAASKVSVVITTRNRRALLAEAVASVQGQRGVSWELIIVDDASTDDTEAYVSGLTDVVAIRQATHGERSRARNRGLDAARGQYVMFLDDDDTLHEEALLTLARALDQHASAVAAVGARQDWFVDESYRRRDIHPWRTQVRYLFDEFLFGFCSCSGQNLYRADVLRAVGGYDEDLERVEDRDLWLRVSRRGPIVLCPQTTMTYRILPGHRLPPDIRQRRERVARRAIRALPRSQWRYALRLRRCTALIDGAEDEVMFGRPYLAAPKVARAAYLAPRLILSPLIATWIARRLLGRAYHRYLGRRS
jgi:glycosyltransferase involved in cell wall biosynthesis